VPVLGQGTMTAFLVTGWVNECVQNGSNLSEVHCGLLNQGEEVDAADIPMEERTARQMPSCEQELGFQGLLEFCMLFRRASKFLFAGGLNCFIWRAGRLSRTYVRYYAQTNTLSHEN
jgi:hypothetical protein